MYIPNYFELFELLPKEFFKRWFALYGNKLWQIFPTEVLWTQDMLRETYGRIVVNDWHWGGENQWRGYRTMDCPIGAPLSMHKFALAVDCVFMDTDVREVRRDIMENPDCEEFQYIRCIEVGTPHLHWDFRNHLDGIKVVEP